MSCTYVYLHLQHLVFARHLSTYNQVSYPGITTLNYYYIPWRTLLIKLIWNIFRPLLIMFLIICSKRPTPWIISGSNLKCIGNHSNFLRVVTKSIPLREIDINFLPWHNGSVLDPWPLCRLSNILNRSLQASCTWLGWFCTVCWVWSSWRPSCVPCARILPTRSSAVKTRRRNNRKLSARFRRALLCHDRGRFPLLSPLREDSRPLPSRIKVRSFLLLEFIWIFFQWKLRLGKTSM